MLTNDYLQLEQAFAGKPGFEGVKMISLRYVNLWDLDDCQLCLILSVSYFMAL